LLVKIALSSLSQAFQKEKKAVERLGRERRKHFQEARSLSNILYLYLASSGICFLTFD